MNRRYGLSADATLKAAQALYEAKLITYPRTDSRYLDHRHEGADPDILDDLRPEPARGDRPARPATLAFTGRIVNDAKVKRPPRHHPHRQDARRPRRRRSGRSFDAIVTRLIAAFYPACVKEVTTVDGESNGVPFRARGVRIVEPGWTVLYPREDRRQKGRRAGPARVPPRRDRAARAVRQERRDDAPEALHRGLLGAMETAGGLVDDEQLKEAAQGEGLGTPATRASIIETLLARGYIVREKRR